MYRRFQNRRTVRAEFAYSGKPSYKSIKNLLAAAKDVPGTEPEASQAVKPHGITRGARYYGGKQS